MSQRTADDQARPGLVRRSFPGTELPIWLLLILIGLGLPRTILADLDIVAPESSWVYFVLALTPFAVWLAIAVLRRTGSPIKDHLLAGALYGLSLVIVHEVLWGAPGHQVPQSAQTLAEQFGPPLRELIPHGFSFLIAMTIGVGFGLVAGLVAAIANRIRRVRAR